MRRFKRIIALIAVCAMLLRINAFASMVLTKETSVDLWNRVFYSDQVRLYPNGKDYGYGRYWPYTSKAVNISVTSSFYPGTKSVQEVFGSESLNLLFNEGDSVYSSGLYLKDEGRILTFYGMCEWNGYLFCAVGGADAYYTTYTYTATDGSTTTDYDNFGRQDGRYAVSITDENGKSKNVNVLYDGTNYRATSLTGTIIPDELITVKNLYINPANGYCYYPGYLHYDSYLYVFDLSSETWYGDCRYAKWDLADLGLQSEETGRQVIEAVDVDDDYIYLTLCTNKADSKDSSRSVAVFENNVSRDYPVYDDETGDIEIPARVEPAETVESYTTGAKTVVSHAMARQTSTATIGYYHSAIINGYLVTWDNQDSLSLASTTAAKTGAIFHVTDLTDVEGSGVGETKVHYLDSGFSKQADSTGVYMSQLIPLANDKTWNSVTNAYIRSIVAEGSTIYILTTYTEKTEDGEEVYRDKVYITDWTNPLKPTLQAQFEFTDNVAMSAKTNPDVTSSVTVSNNDSRLYYYDGYFYITSAYGLNIVKKYNDDNVLDPQLVATYDYMNEGIKYKALGKTGISSIPMVVSVGNCVLLNYETGSNLSGNQVELRLSPDKTEISEQLQPNLSYYTRNPSMGATPQNKIVRYGNRIYIVARYNGYNDVLPARVHVFDFSKAFPVELSLDHINAIVSAPYTVTGSGMGINAVQIKVNGEEHWVNVSKASGKYGTWEYTIEEPGTYTIEATGATLVGYPKEATAEHATFTVVATGDVGYEAGIEEKVNDNGDVSVIISPRIVSNSMTGYIDVMPVAAAYNGNKMITAQFGTKVRIEKGETYDFEPLTLSIPEDISGYKVKTFLFDGTETLSAMADFIEKEF